MVYILSSLIKKNYRKERKKETGERVHKTVTLGCKLWLRKNGYMNALRPGRFEW